MIWILGMYGTYWIHVGYLGSPVNCFLIFLLQFVRDSVVISQDFFKTMILGLVEGNKTIWK